MLSDIPHIATYRGFASESRIIFNARLLKDRNHISGPRDSFLSNLKNIFRKVASREIPYGHIAIEINGNTVHMKADEEGYIFLDEPVTFQRTKESRWESIIIDALNSSHECEYLIPSSEASHAIISDIDDTILVTEVHKPVKMLINSLLKNPYQRSTFDGIQEFYNTCSAKGKNPVFYLSNSPWNLYKNIKQFLEIQQLPKGPILLRDYGLHFPKVPHSFSNHKEINMELLLEVYPNLPFILIGDASQEDAIIYSHIFYKYPTRIKNIFIREVNNSKKMQKLFDHPEVAIKHIKFFKKYSELRET